MEKQGEGKSSGLNLKYGQSRACVCGNDLKRISIGVKWRGMEEESKREREREREREKVRACVYEREREREREREEI